MSRDDESPSTVNEWLTLSEALSVVSDRTRLAHGIADVEAAKEAIAALAYEGFPSVPAAIASRATVVPGTSEVAMAKTMSGLWKLLSLRSESASVDWATDAATIKGPLGRSNFNGIELARADIDRLWPEVPPNNKINGAKGKAGRKPYNWDAAVVFVTAKLLKMPASERPDLMSEPTDAKARIANMMLDVFAQYDGPKPKEDSELLDEHAARTLKALQKVI